MDVEDCQNINDLREAAQETLDASTFDYMVGGSDDLRTLHRNSAAFTHYQIRPRRLVDVSSVETGINIFGERLTSPIFLAPVGLQQLFHQDGELATARAANKIGNELILSTLSSYSYPEIASESELQPWFQLYPTNNLDIRKQLLSIAEDAGAKVLVLTVDVPVIGNRESHARFLDDATEALNKQPSNLKGLITKDFSLNDPSMTWGIVDWLRKNCDMRILIKGIMTKEDTELCLQADIDGIIVSNHGGRQLESDLSTIECLPEVITAAEGKIPVLIDGGFYRGTDIFKALALGASAICIGRAFCYGLAAYGQPGVEKALEILQQELVRCMQLAGTASIKEITPGFLQKAN